ncbi:MAG: GNAT family N-acetyltransferase [Chloroflexi bacterium]|nr:GNAT family N-acetyltransferase [Chloroflexota bacterium]
MPIEYKRDLDGIDWAQLKAELASDDFDNGRTPEQYQRSFAASYSVCFALDGQRIIGKARALSDGVCNGYIVDVWTHSDYRRQGIASTIVKQILADLLGQHVCLFTDDMQTFYLQLGFAEETTGMSQVIGQWLQKA